MDLAVALYKEKHTPLLPKPRTASINSKYHQHGSGPCYKDRFNLGPTVAKTKSPDSTCAPSK